MSRTLRFNKSVDKIKNHFEPYKRWKIASIREKYIKALGADEWYIETPLKRELSTGKSPRSNDTMQAS